MEEEIYLSEEIRLFYALPKNCLIIDFSPPDIHLVLKWLSLKANFDSDFAKTKSCSFAIIQKPVSHLIDHSNYFHSVLQIIKIPFPHCRVGIRMTMEAAINIMIAMKT